MFRGRVLQSPGAGGHSTAILNTGSNLPTPNRLLDWPGGEHPDSLNAIGFFPFAGVSRRQTELRTRAIYGSEK